jgi:TRAP-type C4-dicarboxylate transport system permease small subunit
MVSKDQAIGWVIFLVCAVVVIGYVATLFGYDQIIKPWLNLGEVSGVRFWLIAVPVLIGFVAILAIGAWIGWTMATTPPPKPIEEIETESEAEERKSKEEEKS